jgi:hypothetical protein
MTSVVEKELVAAADWAPDAILAVWSSAGQQRTLSHFETLLLIMF